MGPGDLTRRSDFDVVADERRLDSPHALDGRTAHHDGVLDLTAGDHAAGRDRSERADVRAADPRPGADDGGADDAGPADLRARLDHHPSDQLARIVYRAAH